MFPIFFKPSATRIATTHLEDARRSLLEHRAAAEHYEALADMYERRVARLEADLQSRETAEN